MPLPVPMRRYGLGARTTDRQLDLDVWPTMTTQPIASAATTQRTRLPPSTPDRSILALVVIAFAVLLTRGFAQAVTPFIRQDDWPFLLPAGTPGVIPTRYYDLS